MLNRCLALTQYEAVINVPYTKNVLSESKVLFFSVPLRRTMWKDLVPMWHRQLATTQKNAKSHINMTALLKPYTVPLFKQHWDLSAL